MKNLILVLTAFCFCLLTVPAKAETAVQKLTSINAEWSKQPESNRFNLSVVGKTETRNDLITIHLMLVEEILRSRDVSTLSSTQRINRNSLLDELHMYWVKGVYPVNNYVNYITPVFIDEYGTHCAVGYLMQQSGNDVLAQAINNAEKFSYVRQIQTPGAKEWADKNGFTLGELAWIQPGYEPNTKFSPVGNGTNGNVRTLQADPYNNGLIIGGDFDTIGDVACAQVGRYHLNQLECLGTGLTGTLNDIAVSNVVIAAGNFELDSKNYPLAYFDSLWHFVEIPNRTNAVATAVCTSFLVNSWIVSFNSDTIPGIQEIWSYSDYHGWNSVAAVKGIVYDIASWAYDRCIYVGAFDTAYIPISAISDTVVKVNNVIAQKPTVGGWLDINGAVSDTILTVQVYGNSIYLGGVCNSDSGRSDICLSRFLNGTLQPLVTTSNFTVTSGSVNSIQIYYDNNLLIGGNFESYPLDGLSGSHLGLYHTTLGYMEPYGRFDFPVNALAAYAGEYYLAGEFTKTRKNKKYRHLAKIDNPTAIDNVELNLSFKIYPNPTSDLISLELSELVPDLTLNVFDMLGRELIAAPLTSVNQQLDMTPFPQGTYLLKLQNGTVHKTIKFSKI